MSFLVTLVAALVPLLITPGLVSYFDVTPKIAILLCAPALILLYRSENVHHLAALWESRAGRWFMLLLGAGWLSTAVATLFSSNSALSLNGGNWRRLGLISETALLLYVLLAAAWLAASRDNVRSLLRAAAASGAVSAVYGILQYFGWDPFIPPAAYHVGGGSFTIVRPPGTLGHADYFAAWLVVIVFFAVALARMEEVRWRKLSAGATAALATIAIVLSGTRSALLGLIAGAIVLLLLDRSRLRMRALVVALACVAGFALFYISPAGTKLRARVFWSTEDGRGGARLLLWRDSLRMAVDRPFAGFGPETFASDFARYESIELARAYPDFYHESPHNMFLDALTTRGLFGLFVLLGLCGLACWSAALALRSKSAWVAPVAAGAAATLVCQQFIVFIAATALYWYLMQAMLIAATVATEPAQPRRYFAWLVPAALLASLFLVAFAVRLVVADRELALAQTRIDSGDAKAASEAYSVAVRWQPPGAGGDLNYSVSMAGLAARAPIFATRMLAQQQALDAGVRATSTAEDRHNAWYNLATLFAAANDAAGVERSLRNSIAWAPNWFKPHWALAQLLELTGHHPEALAEAQSALDRDGGRHPEVSETWRKLHSEGSVHP